MGARRTAWGVHAEIAAALRTRIASGSYPAGSRLPSETTLGEEFRVVRNTVRRALAALEGEGLIDTVPGTGRVVRTPGQPPGASPRYRQIAEELRAQIEGGELAPGDLLPSEAALVDRYRVSRGTARQALIDLETAGLVESWPGKGRIVRRRPEAGGR